MKEAKYYEKLDNKRVHCYLCPRHCKIGDGQPGFCFIRQNRDGVLYQLAYGHPYAVNIDPIEKKPLFHYLPGTRILSLGTAGCNMGCKFCQNWNMSKAKYIHQSAEELSPVQAVQMAENRGCRSVAYTYNEPTIWAEFAEDISSVAHGHGLGNVMVTNGYITPEVIHEVYRDIDAANVDLKSFSEEFYRKITLTQLEPVLEALTLLQNMGVWVEITTLIIPTLNDQREELQSLCEWVVGNLGPDVPMHFTAFHPDYKLRDKPRTPVHTLETAREWARDVGVNYVYVGNVHSSSANTYCPECETLLIDRSWHNLGRNRLTRDGCCPQCGHRIPGRFTKAIA